MHGRRPAGGGAAALAAALLLAACGGASAPGVASVASTSTAARHTSAPAPPSGPLAGAPPGRRRDYTLVYEGAAHSQLLRFAACMRRHGVPAFPDPTASGAIHGSSIDGFDPASPLFAAAAHRCGGDLPRASAPSSTGQAAMDRAALRYSRCMRARGVAGFPDPRITAAGLRIGLAPGAAAARIVNSPIFQRAAAACARELPARPAG